LIDQLDDFTYFFEKLLRRGDNQRIASLINTNRHGALFQFALATRTTATSSSTTTAQSLNELLRSRLSLAATTRSLLHTIGKQGLHNLSDFGGILMQHWNQTWLAACGHIQGTVFLIDYFQQLLNQLHVRAVGLNNQRI
jgi:hypothetical protein